mmetsp:Transcript_53252/g.169130  ORF Transcript_53252/g.169130 Transcript_53252/m.169130 type:complete len:226 (+) Transcript_53252:1052-1729(+)
MGSSRSRPPAHSCSSGAASALVTTAPLPASARMAPSIAVKAASTSRRRRRSPGAKGSIASNCTSSPQQTAPPPPALSGPGAAGPRGVLVAPTSPWMLSRACSMPVTTLTSISCTAMSSRYTDRGKGGIQRLGSVLARSRSCFCALTLATTSRLRFPTCRVSRRRQCRHGVLVHESKMPFMHSCSPSTDPSSSVRMRPAARVGQNVISMMMKHAMPTSVISMRLRA